MKITIVFAAVLAAASAQYNPFDRQPGRYNPATYRPLVSSTYRPPVVSTFRPPVSSTYRPPVRVQPSTSDQAANIVRYLNEIFPDGSYNHAIETDNGIAIQAQGTPRDFGGNPPVVPVVSQGAFSWTSPEGQPISITYIADENGYQPSGDSIPTPPPIPELILRSLEFNAKYPSQQK